MEDKKIEMALEFSDILVAYKNHTITRKEAISKLMEEAEAFKFWTKELPCGCRMGWCDCE